MSRQANITRTLVATFKPREFWLSPPQAIAVIWTSSAVLYALVLVAASVA